MEGTYISPEAAPEPKKDNTLLIIVAVIAGLILLCCCCLAIVYFGFLLAGPAVGNVFSNIVNNLVITPTP
jgi:hypothetical protein